MRAKQIGMREIVPRLVSPPQRGYPPGVERKSRSTLLVHLPRMEGHGEIAPVKNGSSLGGYGAVAVNAAPTASMMKLPQQLRKRACQMVCVSGVVSLRRRTDYDYDEIQSGA